MTAAGTFALDTNTYLTSVTAHNLLSATHGDTLADSVASGDIMYGNATPKWARLAKGADGKYLKLVSGLPSWETVTASCNWDDVGDPDADTEIAMAGYETLWTSTLNEAAHTVFTISDTTADLTAAVTLFKLKYTDDGDADGTFAEFLDNSGADSMFKFGAAGLLTLAGGISHDDTSATDWTLAQLEQDKDVLVTVNDGGVTRTAIQIHGTEGAISFPRQSSVCAYRSTNQTIANTTSTAVVFDTEVVDTLGEFNNTTGIFTAKVAGTYLAIVKIEWAAVNNGVSYYSSLQFNGVTKSEGQINGPATNNISVSLHTIAPLSAGQQIKVMLWQNSGGNESMVGAATANSNISIIKVS
jgi:hypothetical protein